MPKNLDELDNQIIWIAREFFLSKGIRKTEMKDIAKAANIGRSTLYRHFSNKEDIAFYIAKDILSELQGHSDQPIYSETMSGFDKLEQELKHYSDKLINNTDKVRFLDEFDQLFTDTYPKSEVVMDYIEFNRGKGFDSYEFFKEGIEDGSIKPVANPEFEVDVLMNLALGMAQRIIPRAQHYIEEHGFSRELVEEAVRLMLIAVKA